LRRRSTVELNTAGGAYPVLTVNALLVESDVVEQLTRYPQEQWDDVLSMAIWLGLQAVALLDVKHVDLFRQLHELRRLKDIQKSSLVVDDGGIGQLWESIRRLDSDRHVRKHWQAQLDRDVAQLMAKWIAALATSSADVSESSDHVLTDFSNGS
jgi:hypothetical protein